MSTRVANAAHASGGVLSSRAQRQEWTSRLLRGLLHEHDCSQEDIAAELGVEQSRVSRWCDARNAETVPLHDALALAQSEIPRVRAVGVGLLRAVALDAGLGVVDLPAAAEMSCARAAARLVRETGEVVADVLEAHDNDALIDAQEGARIEPQAMDVVAAALVIVEVARRAQRERVVSLVERRGGKGSR